MKVLAGCLNGYKGKNRKYKYVINEEDGRKMNYVLTICKSSYNRKQVLIPDIKDYLSVDDDRFLVKVNDNCSTDGTVEALSQINDPRFSYFVNDKNLGPMPNSISALSNAKSDYVMLILDKDTIDVELLPDFITFLEKERPNFGYVDLSNNKPEAVYYYKAGYDCLLKIGYHSKHPSGYFWRTDLWEEEIEKQYFKELDPQFDFPFEIINGSLGARYDGVVLVKPLVINATLRAIPNTQTMTYFDEDRFFFGKKKLLVSLDYYISNLMKLELELDEKKKLAYDILKRSVVASTIQLHVYHLHLQLCSYYHLKYRKIGSFEMINNMIDVLKAYQALVKDRLSIKSLLWQILRVFCSNLVRIVYIDIKHTFFKQEQFKITAG